MAKKDRTIAGFNDVASDGTQPNINNENKDKINLKDNNKNNDSLDDVVNDSGKNSKVNTHVLKGIYFEPEVAKAIDRLAVGKGKGIKSDLVNEAVKTAFKQKGWL